MGNAKSLNRAEIEQAAASGEWDNNAAVLTVIKDVQAKKKRGRKSKKERQMDAAQIDEIYDLVVSLKNEGERGEELLDRFVRKQKHKSPREASALPSSEPPVQTIMINTSSSSNKTRARAA